MSPSLLWFLTLLLLTSCSQDKDFMVGGNPNAWAIPSSTSRTLNQWAEATRFQVGDSLVWKYNGAKDWVLQVTREAYVSCNTSSPVVEHSGGDTVIELTRSGPYCFISGAECACGKGEKLIVVVVLERHAVRGLAPAPAPEAYDGPAVAPVSGVRGMVVGKALLGSLCWRFRDLGIWFWR